MTLRRRGYLIEKEKSGLEKFKEKHGIVSMKIPGNKVDSIGFSEREKKWYGWSHRAIYGFGIGHTVKPGNMPTKYVGTTIKSLDQAKKVAIAFAQEVA